MQQHPVPRDIIGFRFKLIGEMTIKQFAYLAVGVVVGYILFRALPLPGAVPLAIGFLFAGGGAALAFVPLQGRPLDIWIKAYFKSVYSPTQFIWRKQNPPPKILDQLIKTKHPFKKKQRTPKTQPFEPDREISHKHYEEVEQKLSSYLKKAEQKPHEVLDKREQKALKQTETVMQTIPATPPHVGIAQDTTGQDGKGELTTQVSNGVKKQTTEEAIRARIKKELEQQYKEELERLKREKTQIEKKMKRLATPAREEEEPIPALEDQSHLRILSQTEATEAGFPLHTNQPNVIIGTIIDPQQQKLPGILVTIKNKDGKIVRALKTNNLGLFVSSTSLPNGGYILAAEDPEGRFKFDIIRIGLYGKVFPPIALIAKTQQESKQEEIRQKLFAKQTTSANPKL